MQIYMSSALFDADNSTPAFCKPCALADRKGSLVKTNKSSSAGLDDARSRQQPQF